MQSHLSILSNICGSAVEEPESGARVYHKPYAVIQAARFAQTLAPSGLSWPGASTMRVTPHQTKTPGLSVSPVFVLAKELRETRSQTPIVGVKTHPRIGF